jgi:serine-type anaerobic sulfatase-maturating enzyme
MSARSVADGESGLNYLCAGYKAFFHHIDRPMQMMSERLRQGRAPSELLEWYRVEDERAGARAARE